MGWTIRHEQLHFGPVYWFNACLNTDFIKRFTTRWSICAKVCEIWCEFSFPKHSSPLTRHIFNRCVFLHTWAHISIQFFIPPSTPSVKPRELWEISVSDPILPWRTLINVHMFLCLFCVFQCVCVSDVSVFVYVFGTWAHYVVEWWRRRPAVVEHLMMCDMRTKFFLFVLRQS